MFLRLLEKLDPGAIIIFLIVSHGKSVLFALKKRSSCNFMTVFAFLKKIASNNVINSVGDIDDN